MPLLTLVFILLSFGEILSANRVASSRKIVRTVAKTVAKPPPTANEITTSERHTVSEAIEPSATAEEQPRVEERQYIETSILQPIALNDEDNEQIEVLVQLPDLFQMVRQGDIEAVREFLAEELADINALNAQGDSVLHIAATLGNFEMVKLLTEHGADMMLRDRLRRTASQRAGRHPELQKFLQKKTTELCRYSTNWEIAERDRAQKRKKQQEEEQARRAADQEKRRAEAEARREKARKAESGRKPFRYNPNYLAPKTAPQRKSRSSRVNSCVNW